MKYIIKRDGKKYETEHFDDVILSISDKFWMSKHYWVIYILEKIGRKWKIVGEN